MSNHQLPTGLLYCFVLHLQKKEVIMFIRTLIVDEKAAKINRLIFINQNSGDKKSVDT